MEITYQQRIRPDGEFVSVPGIPSDATVDEIEDIVANEAVS